MKISILLTDGAKQIMLTPETDHEKQALKMIAPTDEIKIATKWGQYDRDYKHTGVYIDKCQGGYYREFENSESLMFIVGPKEEDKNVRQ